MPKYLVNTPKFTPVSFAERIKPIDAYKQTYDKISEDEMKTTALLDMIPSMLDTTNEKDAALNKQYEDFRASMSSMVDNIASGNLRNMAADARSLKENYTKYFAKIPIAYNAKMEAIKNFKGGADWLGDRPEYHPTSDYIGTTPTYFGMGANDVYKTGKDVMQGIAKSINNDLPWTRNPDLLNKYFTHVVEEGTSEAAVARFAQMLRDDAALYANVPLTDDKAFDYANRITQAMNSGYNSIVGMYHAENLDNPDERVKFKNAALAGMQAGSEYKVTEKELQNPEMTAARRGSYSGGGSGSGSGSDNYINYGGAGFSTGSTDTDGTPGRASKKVAKLSPYVIDASRVSSGDLGKTYYATSDNIQKFENTLTEINDRRILSPMYGKFFGDEYDVMQGQPDMETKANISYQEDRQKFITSKLQDPLELARAREILLDNAKQKYLVKPVEKLAKDYNYLGMDNPYDNANYGAAIKDRGAAVTHKTFSITPNTSAEETTTIRNILSQGWKHGDPKGTIVRINGDGTHYDLTQKDSEKLMKDFKVADAKLQGDNQYGITINYQGNDYYFARVNEFIRTKGIIDALKCVYDFTPTGKGMDNITKITRNEVNNLIRNGKVPTSTLTNVGSGYYVAAYQLGDDIVKIGTDSTGNILHVNGQPLVQYLSDYATGDTSISSVISQFAIDSVYGLGIKPKTK